MFRRSTVILDMPGAVQGRSSRWVHVLRWGAFFLLLLVVVVAGTALYLHRVGIPRFVTSRLVAELRARGLALEMERIHLRGLRITVEKLRVRPANARPGPDARMDLTQVQLDLNALKQGQIRVRSILVERGVFSWNQGGTNSTARPLPMGSVSGELRFLPDDQVELTNLHGRLLNLDLRGDAIIEHASQIRGWDWFKRAREPKSQWPDRADELLAKLEALHLPPESQLHLRLRGDGRDPSRTQLAIRLQTPKADWNGGQLENAELEASLSPGPTDPGTAELRVAVKAEHIDLPHLDARGLALTSRLAGTLTNRNLSDLEGRLQLDAFRSHSATGQSLVISFSSTPEVPAGGGWRSTMVVSAAAVQTPWSSSIGNHATIYLTHGLSFHDAWQADWSVGSGLVRTPWGEARRASISGHAAPQFKLAAWRPIGSDGGLWTEVEPFELEWNLALDQVHAPQLELEEVYCAGVWHAPEFLLQQLAVKLYGGGVQASGSLDIASREAVARAALSFDFQKVSPLLTPKSRQWLTQFGWQTPPEASGSIRAILPAWTDAHPRWRDEVMPTVELAGEFSGRNGSFRGVSVSYGRSRFTLTNSVWHLPDLLVQRPDGEATLVYTGDMQTHDFHWKVDGHLNPSVLKPLLADEAAQQVLDQFEFTSPPAIRGEVSGRWENPQSVGFEAQVAATNFTFRGERCSTMTARVGLAGPNLHFSDVALRRDAQEITVPSGTFDLTERVVYVTNAVSTMDPDLVTRVIGPKVHTALQPYRFEVAPRVRVNGRLPTVNIQDADVHFRVAGDSFSYWKLHATAVTADVYWRGDALSISSVQAEFCEGALDWQGTFDFSPPVGAQMGFQAHLRRANLHAVMESLGSKTNNAQGALDAHLKITNANSDDWRSWQGFGEVRLRDGFLWDIPIFGFFSPVLNGIVPGLGTSPIKAGAATFKIEDSVVRTSNLELKSPALRLRYTGSVDFKGATEARVQAEILRDAWGVGRVLSLALWPISKAFEYRITGSVYQPHTDPVYIPKMLMWPLHPWKSLKRLFRPGSRQPKPAPDVDFFTPTP